MTKQELRKVYREKRMALSPAETAQYNLRLYHHFFSSIDLSFVRVLHTYLPLAKFNEPDTWMILDRVRREFPAIRVVIPRIKEDTLENFYFEGQHQLQTNSLGIAEPKQGSPALPEKIDMVLIPLLAIDEQGHRIGYGKGFYDKFLQTCRPDCKKIGLSFFPPLKKIEDLNSHDVPLNACVSPEGVRYF